MNEINKTSDILGFLAPAHPSVFGEANDNAISRCASIFEKTSHALCFTTSQTNKAAELLRAIEHSVILVDRGFPIENTFTTTNCVVQVDDPKLWYVRALAQFFDPRPVEGVHSTAIIDETSKIGTAVSVGPYAVIGKNCSIGPRSRIGAHVVLHDNTIIGEGCDIGSATVIGKIGWGHVKDEQGIWVQFPHLGHVEIGNFVEIGTQVSIDRGALSPTRIGHHTKIDSHTHIGHNSQVGQNCMILGSVLLAGTVVVGDNVWIGAGTTVSDHLHIGDNSFITLGSTVVRNVNPGERVTGYFARDHQGYLTMMLDEQRKYFR